MLCDIYGDAEQEQLNLHRLQGCDCVLCLHCVLMDDGEQCSGLLCCNELSLGGQICCRSIQRYIR